MTSILQKNSAIAIEAGGVYRLTDLFNYIPGNSAFGFERVMVTQVPGMYTVQGGLLSEHPWYPNPPGSFFTRFREPHPLWASEVLPLAGDVTIHVDPGWAGSTFAMQVYHFRVYDTDGSVEDGDYESGGYDVDGTWQVEALFTEGPDVVSFSSLTDSQISAVKDASSGKGAALYDALAGNDVVVLPDSTTIAATSVAWNASRVFSAGAGHDRITGGALADLIRGNSGNDRLYGNGASDKLWGEAGLDTLWGGAGRDSLSGGLDNDLLFGDEGNDLLNGNEGQDTIRGEHGNDRLNGGKDSDRLFGGADEDTFIFASTAFVNSWARLDQARNLQFNLDGTNVTNRDGDGEVVLSSPGEGLDFIQDGEIAQFQNGKQDLSAMKIIIERPPDGHAKGEVWDNGVLDKKLTALISGEAGPSTKPLKDMLWDTLTPIAAKSYSGHYRNDGTLLGERIELSGWSNGEGKIVEDDIVRSNIQIHAGRNNGQSEGCFLVSGTFRNALFDHLRASVAGDGDFQFNKGRFYPVIPVVIEVEGEVPQTKIVGIDDTVTRPLSGKGPVEATVGFDVREFGLKHHLKSVDLFFMAKADGKDWILPKKVVHATDKEPAGGQGHGQIWREDTDGGQAVYGIRIGVANDIMRSQVKFDIPIGAGSPSKIDFKIVDLDLWTKSSKGWAPYGVSKDKDTDGANGAEKLLLAGLNSNQLTSTITVTSSKSPALAAEPNDAFVVASVDTFAGDFLF